MCVCVSEPFRQRESNTSSNPAEAAVFGWRQFTPVTLRPHRTPPRPPLKASAPWDHPYTTLLLTLSRSISPPTLRSVLVKS